MIHINLYEKNKEDRDSLNDVIDVKFLDEDEKEENKSNSYRSKPRQPTKQYMMGLMLGASFFFGNMASQYLNPFNIIQHIRSHPPPKAYEIIIDERQGKESQESFFSLIRQEEQSNYKFSILTQSDENKFSLQAFQPKTLEELCKQDNTTNSRPAVLDTIDAKKGEYVFVVNKQTQKAQLYKLDYILVDETDVSTGKKPGQKESAGDNKTPEGQFEVVSVEDSSNWTFEGKRAYGPKFARLSVGSYGNRGEFDPHGVSSIGMHGTDEPEKLGSPESHGCVRFDNEVIAEYVEKGYVEPGTKIVIISDAGQVPALNISAQPTYYAGHAVLDRNYQAAEPRKSIDEILNESKVTINRMNQLLYDNQPEPSQQLALNKSYSNLNNETNSEKKNSGKNAVKKLESKTEQKTEQKPDYTSGGGSDGKREPIKRD